MREETSEQPRKLRSGYTTGACATAVSLAAARLLLTGEARNLQQITLPRGQQVDFELTRCLAIDNAMAEAATIKDAGDDPDATHGACVFARVALEDSPGVRFHAAPGVGIVTREGLSIAVGEAAINPVPRKMMTEHLLALADELNYSGGFALHIGMENGEEIAKNTMNGRLGIIGGVSILGTTGIVRPFSCAAYIASIHQSIDVAHANGIDHIAACTGSSSEQFIKQRLQLNDMAIVEMGDFVGAVLKHLRRVPMQRLTICGGFGKISKLAAGHQSLHSKDAAIDIGMLRAEAQKQGGNAQLLARIDDSHTSLQVLKLCQQADVDIVTPLCNGAREFCRKVSQQKVAVDVVCVDKQGVYAGQSNIS